MTSEVFLMESNLKREVFVTFDQTKTENSVNVDVNVQITDKTIFVNKEVARIAKFLSIIILTSDTTRLVVPLTAEKTLGWKVEGLNVLPFL